MTDFPGLWHDITAMLSLELRKNRILRQLFFYGRRPMKTLYYNGDLYTGDPEAPRASAMVVESGRILWVGDAPETCEADRRVDLKGRFVTPGFIDSHLHVVEYGKLLREASLADSTGSIKQVCDRVRAYIRDNHIPEGTWVCGRGWNQDYFQDEKRFLTCRDLDGISTKHPVFLARACGHVVSVNSKAMELAGITRDSEQPPDGRFQTFESGEPNGVFEENGIFLVKDVIPAVTVSMVKEYILEAAASLNRFGITSVHTDDFLSLPGVGCEAVLKAYRELEDEGRLTIKVWEQSQFENLEQLKEFTGRGYRTGSGTDYVKIGPVKIISDGSLGARTAFLSEPYADRPDARGIPVFTQDQLDEMIGWSHSHGMSVAVHAIGDKAMEQAVSAIGRAVRESPGQNCRHGIVHCQITTKALLEKFRELSLHPYIQSIFLDYDSKIVESRVGAERARDTYQFKTLLDMGCDVSNGSDCPVETPDVMKGIQCAVTRSSLDGGRTFLPEQALTVEEALASYTVMGARAAFEEENKGMLRAGMAGDFVVFPQNLLETPPGELGRVSVDETWVDGVQVYKRP